MYNVKGSKEMLSINKLKEVPFMSMDKKFIIKNFEETYEVSAAVQKPFGEAVLEVMRIKGLSGPNDFAECTGLNTNIYYTMQKPDCNIELDLVISICVGLKLDTVSTQLLLQSAGLGFNLNNRIHRAYLYIVEYFKDQTIEECNETLEILGVPASKRLGSYERGPYKKEQE